MKNLNQKGFVLAETLIVTVFMMIIFTMIYTELYPIIGLYEQREIYDDVDGEYAAYWIKRIVEDDYVISENDITKINENGYIRFSCNNVSDSTKNQVCSDLVNALEIKNCRSDGTQCDIYITKYQIGTLDPNGEKLGETFFKKAVKENSLTRASENCNDVTNNCNNNYYKTCCEDNYGDASICENGFSNYKEDIGSVGDNDTAKNVIKKCYKETKSKIFPTAFKDYLNTIPEYENNPNNTKYRVILIIHHQKDGNNYYSFANMEVNK